jgi:hypothetical protein
MSLTMTITITAFERSPDGGKGLARDGAFSAGDLMMTSVLLREHACSQSLPAPCTIEDGGIACRYITP